jgi:hypothetical protein
MGTAHSIMLKNATIHGINNAMDRKNTNREIVTIDPKSLDPNTEVMRF